jgi:hypothetical protein
MKYFNINAENTNISGNLAVARNMVIEGDLITKGINKVETAEQILTKGALTIINSENNLLNATLMGTVIRTGKIAKKSKLKSVVEGAQYSDWDWTAYSEGHDPNLGGFCIGADQGNKISGDFVKELPYYQYEIPLSEIPAGASYYLIDSTSQYASTWCGIIDRSGIVYATEERQTIPSEGLTYDPTSLIASLAQEDRHRDDLFLMLSASEIYLMGPVDYAIIYDPLNEAVRLGLGAYNNTTNTFAFDEGEGYPVAVRDLNVEDDGHLIYWDAKNYCLKATSIAVKDENIYINDNKLALDKDVLTHIEDVKSEASAKLIEAKSYTDEKIENLFSDWDTCYIFDGGDADVTLAILDNTILE